MSEILTFNFGMAQLLYSFYKHLIISSEQILESYFPATRFTDLESSF